MRLPGRFLGCSDFLGDFVVVGRLALGFLHRRLGILGLGLLGLHRLSLVGPFGLLGLRLLSLLGFRGNILRFLGSVYSCFMCLGRRFLNLNGLLALDGADAADRLGFFAGSRELLGLGDVLRRGFGDVFDKRFGFGGGLGFCFGFFFAALGDFLRLLGLHRLGLVGGLGLLGLRLLSLLGLRGNILRFIGSVYSCFMCLGCRFLNLNSLLTFATSADGCFLRASAISLSSAASDS